MEITYVNQKGFTCLSEGINSFLRYTMPRLISASSCSGLRSRDCLEADEVGAVGEVLEGDDTDTSFRSAASPALVRE